MCTTFRKAGFSLFAIAILVFLFAPAASARMNVDRSGYNLNQMNPDLPVFVNHQDSTAPVSTARGYYGNQETWGAQSGYNLNQMNPDLPVFVNHQNQDSTAPASTGRGYYGDQKAGSPSGYNLNQMNPDLPVFAN